MLIGRIAGIGMLVGLLMLTGCASRPGGGPPVLTKKFPGQGGQGQAQAPAQQPATKP